MKSIIFEILRPSNPVLAELGAFAERYCWPDPASALVKRTQLEVNQSAQF